MQSAPMMVMLPAFVAETMQQPMRPAEGQRPGIMLAAQPAPELSLMAVQSPVELLIV